MYDPPWIYTITGLGPPLSRMSGKKILRQILSQESTKKKKQNNDACNTYTYIYLVRLFFLKCFSSNIFYIRKWADRSISLWLVYLWLEFIILKLLLVSEKQKGIENGNICSNATGQQSDSLPPEFDVKCLLTSVWAHLSIARMLRKISVHLSTCLAKGNSSY